MIQIEYMFTPDYLLPALKLHRRYEQKLVRYAHVVVGVAMASYIWSRWEFIVQDGLNTIDILMLIMVGITLFSSQISRYFFSKAIRQSPWHENTCYLKFEEDGMTMKTEDSVTEIKWGKFYRVYLFETGILLYMQKNMFYWASRDLFKEGEFEQAIDMLESGVTDLKKMS